jgi:hypothetical protein
METRLAQDSLRAMRVAGRLANGFTLELVKLGGHRRDVIDALLRATITHANQAHIIRDPVLQRRFATLDEDVPDDLRRPATIHAMAASLRMPFETARRRVGGLVETGVCQPAGKGVIVPHAVTDSPPYRAAVAFQFERLRVLYARLRGVGLLEGLAARPALWQGDAPPLRLAGRLVVEYVLRFNEAASRHIPDVVTSLTLMEMLQANTEHLPDTESGTEAPGPEGSVPDSRRKPVPVTTLAERLGIADETMRRHVRRLSDRGLCRRLPEGYIVPVEALIGAGFRQVMFQNYADLTRMFVGLADFGVLAAWEKDASSSAA